jgi:hypothetical protein
MLVTTLNDKTNEYNKTTNEPVQHGIYHSIKKQINCQLLILSSK